MTTELDVIRDSAPALSATPDPIDNLMRYAQAIEVAYEFAGKLCRTSLVPKAYQGKPADAAVAILHGAELGLNPLQALSNVFSGPSGPTLYAKTMVALLRAKGYKFKTVESGPAKVTVSGWWPGDDPETSTWTIERAIEAGYVPQIDPKTGEFARNKWDKLIGNEKYLTQPEEMLWAKAAATVCRRLAPDVLLGISHTAEDAESEPAPDPVRVQSERVSAADVLGEPPADEQPPTDEQPSATVVEWSAAPSESSEVPVDAEEVPSDSGEKPDTAQASGPEAPGEPPSTRIQQKKIARLLTEDGVESDADKLLAIGTFLGREIGSANDITRAEAIRLLDYLERDPATEDQAPADTEGGDR
ncbi:hypothetical protein [Nocardia sp. NBC_01009]|uniref:hypothetical protein n=1 Tax=Nocardia sp. NBC_01009 TaxID=2975996 RepID=UPI003867F06B|nr:hypothetical protein OHA42_05060 [Nocardia sp. NBC_01009]